MINFARNIYCILGLPFDAISMSDTIKYIRDAAGNNRSCFISTPNLNFLIACLKDKEFRNSVINSNLSIADGMPVIWIAKILGVPIRERVAGSDLYEKLSQPYAKPIKVFFFGGAEGVAERACQRQNAEEHGVIAVGYETPGFGSIEEMSSEEIIEKINASNADFVVVALGAKKGQAWIEHNRDKLKAPIISHLGAVVNFVAGNVKRAPHWFQMTGAEWLWRIYQEPKLWERYSHDGLNFCRLLITKVLPYALWLKFHQKSFKQQNQLSINYDATNTEVRIALKGDCINKTLEPLKELLNELSNRYFNYELDLLEVAVIDSAFIGLCMLLSGYAAKNGGKMALRNISLQNRKIIEWNCASYLLEN